jgi:O-antigen ligase
MRLRNVVSTFAALVAAGVAVFALGGAPRWAQATIAVLIAIAIVPTLWSRRSFDRISPLVALLGIAAALTAIQLVPLPHALVAALDPTGSDLRDDGTSLLGVSLPSTLTLDVPGSIHGLAFFIILLGVAVIALRGSTSERGRFFVLASVALLCGLAAAVVGVHVLLGATELYGFYRPIHTSPHLLGPLINDNHLGSLMAVGTAVSVGLVIYRRQPVVLRALWLVIICGCGAVALLTASRGAFMALIAGVGVALAVSLAQRFASDGQRRTRVGFAANSLSIGVVATCAVVIVLYASAGGIAEQLSGTHLSEVKMPRTKFAAWRSAMTLVKESPWVGVGRGGFETSFTRVHPASAFIKFSHVENEYLQAVVDWGLPGAILLGLAATWFLTMAFRRWRDGPLTAGALGGVLAVVLQSNVDFGIEMLGVAVPVTAVAATLMYVPMRESSPSSARRALALRLAHIVVLSLCVALLMSARTTSVEEDDRELSDGRPSMTEIAAVVARHPLDYYAYRVAADRMIATGDPNAVRVLNHALRLHPTEAGLHLSAARLLYDTGHLDQSASEYGFAMSATADRSKLIAEVVKRFPPETAASTLSVDDGQLDETVATLMKLRHVEVATYWLVRVIQRTPDGARPCEILLGLAMQAADPTIVGAANKNCRETDSTQTQRVVLARALLANQHAEEALGLLADVEQWHGRIDDKANAWLVRCDAYSQLKRWGDAKHCLRRLDASGSLLRSRSDELTQRLGAVDREQAVDHVGSDKR